ncbi:hypothetical protein [Olivibacter domesticus]|uniref:Uncharacterized protein n=1 Tax=Olivibacter domesticus TaxID=407022 RepID=A0A1H7IHA3_OLID1|nr:hypothetical protein [Olivibacter domesticus]SEK60065.1 hypothetical protein SAMN05661044_00653 [Olivibacter domesticus]
MTIDQIIEFYKKLLKENAIKQEIDDLLLLALQSPLVAYYRETAASHRLPLAILGASLQHLARKWAPETDASKALVEQLVAYLKEKDNY